MKLQENGFSLHLQPAWGGLRLTRPQRRTAVIPGLQGALYKPDLDTVCRGASFMALSVISRQCSISVAFRAKRTLSRIYEYTA
jgi:hypothetical protein